MAEFIANLVIIGFYGTIVGLVVIAIKIFRDDRARDEEITRMLDECDSRCRHERLRFHWEKDTLSDKDMMGLTIADFNVLDMYAWHIREDETPLKCKIASVLTHEDGTVSLDFHLKGSPTQEVKDYYQTYFGEKFPDFNIPNQRLIEAKERNRIAINQSITEAIQNRYAEEQAIRAAIPKCPLCHSTNIAPITMVQRVVSTEFLGWASPTIGKSYECKTCGYKW